jgi:hypothetical protein
MFTLTPKLPTCVILALAFWFLLGAGCSKEPSPPEKEEATINLNDLPPLDRPDKLKVRPYVQAAAQIQKLGKEQARKFLTKRAERGDDGQIVMLCRMLFSKKPKGEFRPPMLGAPVYFGGTGLEDWPLLPIELVDDVPFYIVDGFELGGQAEPSGMYLEYCLEHCEWSSARFDKVTDKTIEAALQKLLASKKWKRPLTDGERQRLSSQVE